MICHNLTKKLSLFSQAENYECLLILYYIADLPVTRLRLLTDKSDNIDVPFDSLRSLILLFDPTGFTFLTPLVASSPTSRIVNISMYNIPMFKAQLSVLYTLHSVYTYFK